MDHERRVIERTTVRAQYRREDGIEYKLRVIPGSDGLLELVEKPPKLNPFQEWARAMQLTGWSF